MKENNSENIETRIEELFKKGYINKEELDLLNFMKCGEEITGKEMMDKTINMFIENILHNKKINN